MCNIVPGFTPKTLLRVPRTRTQCDTPFSEDVAGMNTCIEIHNSVVNNLELSLTKFERNVETFSSTN